MTTGRPRPPMTTGSSPGQSSTEGSTCDPACQIEKSNQEIAKKNEKISAKITQRKAASDADDAVKDISRAMESARVKREQRAEAITYARIITCRDFEFKYYDMIEILAVGITDRIIPKIIALVSVLKVHLPNVAICTKQEKQVIHSDTKFYVAYARKKATSYKNKKDEEINQLVKEVQAAQEVIKNANAALAASGQSTIPANTIPDSVVTQSQSI